MTTLNRAKSALLVIDVQVGVMAEAFKREAVIANIQTAVEKARAAGVAVIWVQHSEEEMPIGSLQWHIVPELVPAADEPVIRKTFRSSFVETELPEVLAAGEIGHLVICGAETNNCVRHTCHTALELGYDITLIEDAHTTTGFEWNGYVVDAARVIDEQNTNFINYALPGRSAKVTPLANLAF
jgi:nicotinamidase-related amidase